MTGQNTTSPDDQLRVGFTAPLNLAALNAILNTIQTIWPEATPTLPRHNEVAAIQLPTTALTTEEHVIPEELAETIREDSTVEADALAAQTDVTILAPGVAEIAPPAETLNMLAGYCHAVLDSLPEGSNAVQQTISLPGSAEPYVLSIQPQSQAQNHSPVEWVEGRGWVTPKASRSQESTPSDADAKRRELLQRVASMPNVRRGLSRAMKAQIAEAVRAH